MPEWALGPVPAVAYGEKHARHIDGSGGFLGLVRPGRRVSASALRILPFVRVGTMLVLAPLRGTVPGAPE